MACVTAQHTAFLALVNQLRAQHGRQPLRISAILHDAAAAKAGQLAVRDSHVWDGDPHTLDGVTARELVLQHGYPANSGTGENLLYGAATADSAFEIWVNSGPHFQNMIWEAATEVGIAGPVGGSWTHEDDVFDVWVMELGTARTGPANACQGGNPEPAPRPEPRPRKRRVPRKPPPRNERQKRRRRRWLDRLFGRD